MEDKSGNTFSSRSNTATDLTSSANIEPGSSRSRFSAGGEGVQQQKRWEGTRQEKPRRHTWDTSLVGRLIVWLVFFAAMFLVAFFVPFWFIGIKETIDGTNGVAKDHVHPAGKPVDPSIQERMDNIKSVILQSDISSLSDLDNERSDAHYALRWITEQDPAQIEPLVNHHDNVELLQRYTMAVLFYSTHPLEYPDTLAPSQGNSGSVTEPPAQETPVKEPLATVLPATVPPATVLPATVPPATVLPETVPPATVLPATVPPATVLPATVPPTTVPPATVPPATISPIESLSDGADGNAGARPNSQGGFGFVERPSRTSAPLEQPQQQQDLSQGNSSALTEPPSNLQSAATVPPATVPATTIPPSESLSGGATDNSVVLPSSQGGSGSVERPSSRSSPVEHLESHSQGNSSSSTEPAVLQKHGDDAVPSSRSAPLEQPGNNQGNNTSSTIPEQAVHLGEHRDDESVHGKTIDGNTTDVDNGGSSLVQTVPNETAPLVQNVHLDGNEELTRGSPIGVEASPIDGGSRAGEHFAVALRDEEPGSARVVEVERDNQRTLQTADDEDSSSTKRGWLKENRWMTSAAVCDWYGIECEIVGSHKVIKQLNLTSNNLKGSLPSELQTLTHLEVLDFSGNQIIGTLPTSIARLNQLQSLIVGGNLLTGTVPQYLSTLTTLQELDLSFNAFLGTMPATIAKLSQLRFLNLEGNALEGKIPSLASLKDLSILRLGTNIFTGDIPYHMSLLKNLQELSLQRNQLTGTFLPEFEGLHSLKNLDLSHNLLENEIPGVFDRLHSLESLDLSFNGFAGALPVTIGRLVKLTSLDLSSCEFDGTLPQAWMMMTSLRQLSLDHNKLLGTLPTRLLGGLKSIQNLTLAGNLLSGTIPEILSNIPSLDNLELAENHFSGSVDSLCALKETGSLLSLTADCQALQCDCCDNCGTLVPV